MVQVARRVGERGERRISRAFADWRPERLRRHTAFLLAGLPLQATGLLLPLAVGTVIGENLGPIRRLTGYSGKSTAVLVALVAAVAFSAATAGRLAALHRRRLRRYLSRDLPAPAGDRLTWAQFRSALGSRQRLRAFAARAGARDRWATLGRQLGYHLLAGPATGTGALLALCVAPAGLVAWGFGVGLAISRPPGSPKWGLALAMLGLAGAAALLATPWLIGVAVRLDARAAGRLLGPSRAGMLAHRVEALTLSRAGVVDAADAERRRIERDLHDGAQQRLVSLALNLGLARENLTGLPEEARKVIEGAHEEAKRALTELRSLVRGLHPAILEDRGLDAALSGIAALAPVPVRLRVDVAERPAATVEAVAYFIVSEALANVARHARASRVDIEVVRTADVLRVRVADDGVGGADPAAGTGLAGLARRAGSVDGSFTLSSPPGGPTVIEVALPCVP